MKCLVSKCFIVHLYKAVICHTGIIEHFEIFKVAATHTFYLFNIFLVIIKPFQIN